MKTENAFDVHAHISDHIVTAIAAGAGDWTMPWRRAGGALHRPKNSLTGKAYQGVNVLSLWMAAERQQYAAPLWGTYKQWQEKGAQVRKGERGTAIVFYKDLDIERTDEATGSTTPDKVMFARASWVFNISQVDGAELPDAPLLSDIDPIERIEAVERLIGATGADMREGGDRAYYDPRQDYCAVPDRRRFIGSETSTPTDAWYATKLHELTHWTGAKHRLDRDLSTRFGSDAYAMEELIAELGSAFLCADLGINTAPRPDHAAYVGHWLKVLKDDKRAIFTAASQADKATRYLLGFDAPPEPTRPGARPEEAKPPAPAAT